MTDLLKCQDITAVTAQPAQFLAELREVLGQSADAGTFFLAISLSLACRSPGVPANSGTWPVTWKHGVCDRRVEQGGDRGFFAIIEIGRQSRLRSPLECSVEGFAPKGIETWADPWTTRPKTNADIAKPPVGD